MSVLGKSCGGCPYHEFPYRATIPLGKQEERTFASKKDVYDVIDLLAEEVHENNINLGANFNVAQSIVAQISFFACPNVLITKEHSKDVQRYIYCSSLGVSAYKGTYGEQPCKWVDKFFIYKKAFAELEKQEINKAKRKNN